jgi:hypothetical protein
MKDSQKRGIKLTQQLNGRITGLLGEKVSNDPKPLPKKKKG